jgi:hypothetical protein
MVDAEDLLFAGVAGEFAVELMRRGEIVAEGFLDDDALPSLGFFFMKQADGVEMLNHFSKLARQGREIKETVLTQCRIRKSSELFFETLVRCGISQITLTIEKALGKLLPDLIVHRVGAGKLVQGLPELIAPGGIGFLPPSKADNAEISRHLFFFVKMIESGDEFSGGEIAAGAKDDDRARLDRFAALSQVAAGRDICKCGSVHGENLKAEGWRLKAKVCKALSGFNLRA